MKDVYIRLFNISYNNKIFTIFLDKNYRRAFLEVNDNGTYSYPLLEDFLYLNDLYNNRSPFIADISKFSFTAKVKKVALGTTIYLSIVVPAFVGLVNSTPSIDNDQIILVQDIDNKKEHILIEDVKQLDEILGYKSVNVDEVHAAIDNNPSLSFEYKTKLHLFLTAYNNKYPEADLRIFYENIKTIEVVIVDDDYFAKENTPGVVARYNGEANQLLLKKNFDDKIFYHEVSHIFDIYYREYEDKIIVKGPALGVTLNEAMTNEVADCIATTNSYGKSGVLLNYFRNYVDFDYYDHNQKGIPYLIELLKARYPNVDVEFIVSAMDTADIAEKSKGQYVYLDQVEGLLDEIFKICKIEFEKQTDNYYAPFEEFSKLLYYSSDMITGKCDLMYKYLDEYNSLLEKKGIEIITKEEIESKINKYKDVTSFICQEDYVAPLISTGFNDYNKYCYKIYDETGEETEITDSYYKTFFSFDSNLFFQLQMSSIAYNDIIGTPEYWEKMALDTHFLKTADFKAIPICFDGQQLSTEYLGNLKIAVGLTANEKIGYVIKNQDNNVIYKTDDSLLNSENVSNYIGLEDYLRKYNPKDFDSLELTNVLNDYYLLDLLKDYDMFCNLMIEDGNIIITPKYQINIQDGDKIFSGDLGSCYFAYQDDQLVLSPLEYTTGFEEKVYLKYILDYYGILDENTLQYGFTKEELISYYNNYINDISLDSNIHFGI